MSTLKTTNLKNESSSTNNIVLASDGSVTLPSDTVDIATLSATGTASSSTYLRGDNSWATPAGYTGTATLKAWAAFDGDGDINATLTGGNITSLNDDGTGQYTITFDTDFADDNYLAAGITGQSNMVGFHSEATLTAGSCKIGVLNDGGGYADLFRVTVGFWR